MLSTHIKFIIERSIDYFVNSYANNNILNKSNKKFLGSIILPKINIKADLTTN